MHVCTPGATAKADEGLDFDWKKILPFCVLVQNMSKENEESVFLSVHSGLFFNTVTLQSRFTPPELLKYFQGALVALVLFNDFGITA